MTSDRREMLANFARMLEDQRKQRSSLPRRQELEEFTGELLGVFFPELARAPFISSVAFVSEIDRLEHALARFIQNLTAMSADDADARSAAFFAKAVNVYESIRKDAEAIYQGDPAARSVQEVILAYPGFFAIAVYRFAHELYLLNVPVLPRVMTEYAHRRTGIDIHPGARIADSFCIDHGTGIVIGETAEIGRGVKLYQGVTLGALSVEKSLADRKRHPTLGDHVVVYANATILGGRTRIGNHSVIGGNVWITESVPDNSTVYYKGEISIHPK